MTRQYSSPTPPAGTWPRAASAARAASFKSLYTGQSSNEVLRWTKRSVFGGWASFLLFVRVVLPESAPKSPVWPEPGGWHSVGTKTSCCPQFYCAEWSFVVLSVSPRHRTGLGRNWPVKSQPRSIRTPPVAELASDFLGPMPVWFRLCRLRTACAAVDRRLPGAQ